MAVREVQHDVRGAAVPVSTPSLSLYSLIVAALCHQLILGPRPIHFPLCSYILSMCVNDYTSQIWVSGFNEVGQDLFGKTADEMQRLKEDDETEFTRALTSALGRMYNLNIKAKADSFGDQMRVRYQIQKAAPVDWVEAATKLADEIEKW